jgi:heme-degrading monooxygenase HmoA
MFVMVSVYRARAGQEDKVVALHEEWQHLHRAGTAGFLSAELLRSLKDPLSFIDIARFESEEAAQSIATIPEQAAWHRRLAQLTEDVQEQTGCRREWQLDPDGGSVSRL